MLSDPLQLYHSWPLYERGLRLPHGLTEAGYSAGSTANGPFSCDLVANRLCWEESTFALFGLPVGTVPARDVVLPLYRPESRSALEQLRAHAIRHRRGFTIDVQIDPPAQTSRWLRIAAVAEVESGRTVRLRGVHQDVTHEYR